MVSSSASQHSEESRLMMGETLSGPSNCTKPEKQPSCKRSSQLAFRSDIWENVETCFSIPSIPQHPPPSVLWSSKKEMFFCSTFPGCRMLLFLCLRHMTGPRLSRRFPGVLPIHQMMLDKFYPILRFTAAPTAGGLFGRSTDKTPRILILTHITQLRPTAVLPDLMWRAHICVHVHVLRRQPQEGRRYNYEMPMKTLCSFFVPPRCSSYKAQVWGVVVVVRGGVTGV